MSRSESFFGRPVRFKSSNQPDCLYLLMRFCTEHRELLSCFEIWSWLRPASYKAPPKSEPEHTDE